MAQTNVIAVQRWEDGNSKIIVYNRSVGLDSHLDIGMKEKVESQMTKIFASVIVRPQGRLCQGNLLRREKYRSGNKLNCFNKEILKYSGLYEKKCIFLHIISKR